MVAVPVVLAVPGIAYVLDATKDTLSHLLVCVLDHAKVATPTINIT